MKSNFGSYEYLSHGLYWIFESVISVHWIVEFLVVVNWIVGFVIVVFCWVSPSPIIWKVLDVAAVVGLYNCSQFSLGFGFSFFLKISLCPCWRLGFFVIMLCSDMYLISFVESDSSSTRITRVVISAQFCFGGESEFNSKCMETSEFASWIATVWGNGWSCNSKSGRRHFFHNEFAAVLRQGVKLQSNSSTRSSNLFMNCCCFEAMGLTYIPRALTTLLP